MSDEHADLFGQLEDVFEVVDSEGVEDLSTLNTIILANRVSSITELLLEMGQAIRPETQAARDLHSERNACQIELRKRGVEI